MTAWADVIANQRRIACEIARQPLTDDGADEVIRLMNQASEQLDDFRLADKPHTIVGEEWRLGYRIHRDAGDRWWRRIRELRRERALDRRRADHVALCARATRIASARAT